MISWKPFVDYVEPDWDRDGTAVDAVLFWRKGKGAALGFVRDGELFDSKWVYVCDANKVTHFAIVQDPASNVVDLQSRRAATD